MSLAITYLKTPVGIAEISGATGGIQSITILNKNALNDSDNIPECVLEGKEQLQEYFQKKRTSFDLKLDPSGTDFQKKVWGVLSGISYGKTCSYLDIAKKLGNPKVIRAAASANGRNPLWIVIPCHRVIGSDGTMTGYAGGIWRKKWLLDFENPVKQQSLF